MSEDTADLNNIINQLDILDIYRLLNSLKIGNILDHKTHLKKFRRIEMIKYLFSDHNDIKLEINNKKITEKFPINVENKQHTSFFLIKFGEVTLFSNII